jgi:hypothetical protein
VLSVTSARNTSPAGTERRSLFLLPPSDVQTNKRKKVGSAEATSQPRVNNSAVAALDTARACGQPPSEFSPHGPSVAFLNPPPRPFRLG